MDKAYKFKTSLIIPIYLRVKTSDEIIGVEGLSLLKRVIESLNILECHELVVITVFCVDAPVWRDEFDLAIRKIVMEFSSRFPIVTFTEKNLINLREYFREKGYNKITDKLRVCGLF